MAMGGSTIKTTCGCGNEVAKKGYDDKGRMRYRSQCYKCWYKARKARRKYCEWCEATTQLEIDHIDGDRSNNMRNNLQTLCKPCHMKKTKVCGDIRKDRRKNYGH